MQRRKKAKKGRVIQPYIKGEGLMDSLLKLGKTIISNPDVQASAKELASEGVGEILKSIKARTQKQQPEKPPAKARNATIDRLLKGGSIQYLD